MLSSNNALDICELLLVAFGLLTFFSGSISDAVATALRLHDSLCLLLLTSIGFLGFHISAYLFLTKKVSMNVQSWADAYLCLLVPFCLFLASLVVRLFIRG